MANTLFELCVAVAHLMGEPIEGTPGTDLTTQGFGSAKLSLYEDDYFLDWHGRFRAGKHKDTSFAVTSSEQLRGVIKFAPALSSAVVATDLYYLLQDFTPEELIGAINSAIESVEQEALQDRTDESIILTASTFEYLVPPRMRFIDQILQESGTAGRYSQTNDYIDVRHWSLRRGAQPAIWFDSNFVSLTTGRHLRLVGQESPARLVKDEDISHVPKSYIVLQAKANLHFARADDLDDAHGRKMVLAQSRADVERKRVLVAGRGQKVSS